MTQQAAVVALLIDFGLFPEVADIGDALSIEIPSKGISLRVEKSTGRVCRVQLMGDGEHPYAPFPYLFPFGLCSTLSEAGVRDKLGATPFRAGAGGPAPILGYLAAWENYWHEGYFVSVRYGAPGGGISLLTIEHSKNLSTDIEELYPMPDGY